MEDLTAPLHCDILIKAIHWFVSFSLTKKLLFWQDIDLAAIVCEKNIRYGKQVTL